MQMKAFPLWGAAAAAWRGAGGEHGPRRGRGRPARMSEAGARRPPRGAAGAAGQKLDRT